MLKTRNIFLLLFCTLLLCFSVIFAILIRSQIQTLLEKQYEQKIKTINDILRFSILHELDEIKIKELAAQTRADFIVEFKDQKLSSLELFKDIKSFEMMLPKNLNDKNYVSKKFTYENFTYIIIVYPRLLDLNWLWFFFICIFSGFALILLILLFFVEKKLSRHFKRILEFLNFIDDERVILLENSPFKELNFLNKKLIKTKEKIIKNNLKLKKQRDKISLKNNQLESVISAISHELKNPLSVIDLSIDTLKNSKNDEKIQNLLLEKIARQSTKLNALTHKLNLVFNLKFQPQMQNFDLFELCEKITQNPGFERVCLSGKPCIVSADEFLIEQVIINLLQNALKYSQKEVLLNVNKGKICVRDFGEGIESNKLNLITKKFYKINTKSENSFGLGLFLVKKILNLHKTSLEISSTKNEGSSFSFSLN